jgi:catechol 2,3-dioxygenase-like lactoylglutathione lyase family enzyme
MRGLVHHIDLTVVDPTRSFAFYDTLLTALGYRLEREDKRGFDWNLVTMDGSQSIGIVRASAAGNQHPHDRYSPGVHHLALALESRGDVDRMHAVMIGIGANVLDGPTEYNRYNEGRGYYAVFFADPDGIKLECVFTPQYSVLHLDGW